MGWDFKVKGKGKNNRGGVDRHGEVWDGKNV